MGVSKFLAKQSRQVAKTPRLAIVLHISR